MTKKTIELARYNTLIQLWTHHSSAQLQWPAAVSAGALLVISNIIHENLANLMKKSITVFVSRYILTKILR